MSATEMFQRSASSIMVNKLKIYKGINGCLIVTIGGLMASLANETWKDMDSQARFLLVLGVLLSTLKALDMYLDQGTDELNKTINQLKQSHEDLRTQIAYLQTPRTVSSIQDLQKPETTTQKLV